MERLFPPCIKRLCRVAADRTTLAALVGALLYTAGRDATMSDVDDKAFSGKWQQAATKKDGKSAHYYCLACDRAGTETRLSSRKHALYHWKGGSKDEPRCKGCLNVHKITGLRQYAKANRGVRPLSTDDVRA